MKVLKIRGVQGIGYEAKTEDHPVMILNLVRQDDSYDYYSTPGNKRTLGIPSKYMTYLPSQSWTEIPFDDIKREEV